jgi:soluble lytic murein transglycosylase-like protein
MPLLLAALVSCTPTSAAAHSIASVDPLLVRAVIANESAFDRNATSKAGAAGLMQLMPATAAALQVCNPYSPIPNIVGGTRYLKSLLERFHGDVRLAVAGYNAGPGAVERFHGVPPYPETQAYVRNVLGSYAKYVLAEPARVPVISPSSPPPPVMLRRASPIGTTSDAFKGTAW